MTVQHDDITDATVMEADLDAGGVSAETAGLLAQIAKQGKAFGYSEATPDDDDGEEPEGEPAADPAPEPAAEAAPAEPEKPETTTEAAPAAAAPPPAIVAEMEGKLAASLERIRQAEEAAKPLKERAKKLDERKSRFGSDRIGVLNETIGEMIGTDDPEKIKAARTELYNELTWQVLEVEPPSEDKAASETRTLRRELEDIKRKAREAEDRAAQERQRSEEEQQISTAISTIGNSLQAIAAEVPFLLAEPNAARMVFDVMLDADKAGKDITLKQAAEAANTTIKQAVEKYRHLLVGPTQAEEPKQASATSEATTKATPTLTNAAASQRTAEPPKEPDIDPADEEAYLERTLQRFRRLKAQQSE